MTNQSPGQVSVSKSVPTMTSLTLLSNIGGMLGLLLGLSILDLVDAVDVLFNYVNKTRKLFGDRPLSD